MTEEPCAEALAGAAVDWPLLQVLTLGREANTENWQSGQREKGAKCEEAPRKECESVAAVRQARSSAFKNCNCWQFSVSGTRV